MESLALIVSIIILGRIAFVALCVALTIYYLKWLFVDGLLQRRPLGLPKSSLFRFGLFFALTILGLVIFGSLIK